MDRLCLVQRSKKPEILKEQALLVQTDNSKFIIEALLHDGVSKSIHIIHTHQYQITKYDLTKKVNIKHKKLNLLLLVECRIK